MWISSFRSSGRSSALGLESDRITFERITILRSECQRSEHEAVVPISLQHNWQLDGVIARQKLWLAADWRVGLTIWPEINRDTMMPS